MGPPHCRTERVASLGKQALLVRGATTAAAIGLQEQRGGGFHACVGNKHM